MIYPVDAIDDLWHLPATEFRDKYAGINASGIGPSDEGWYVRYRHENLTYLFGPIAERDDARAKKWELETVRDAAIRNQPNLTSSQVDFVRFTYSGVFGKAGDSPSGSTGSASASARISSDGRSGPDGDLDGDGISNALDDDMDGDGIPNAQDGDRDGDGIPNGADDYAFGSDPGPDGRGLAGDSRRGSAGDGGDGNQGSGQASNQSANGQQAGQAGADGGGGEAGSSGSQGQRGRQVASNQRGGQSGAQGGQDGGQDGQSGQQSSQQSGQQGGQSSQQSAGQSGSPSPMSGGESGGGGNPLQLLGSLLRMILGI